MVSQNWIMDSLKMYKVSDEVIKFIENAMVNWRMELTAEEKLCSSENPARYVQWPLLFVIVMMLLNRIGRYKWHKPQEKSTT